MTSEGVSRPKVEVWCGASDDEVYDSEVPLSPTSSWDSCALSDVDPHELTPEGILDTESQNAPETRALSPSVSSPPGTKPVLHTEPPIDVETKAVPSSVCETPPTTVIDTDSPEGVEDKAVSPSVFKPSETFTGLDTGAANHGGAKAVPPSVCEPSASANLTARSETDSSENVLVDQSEGSTTEVLALEEEAEGYIPLPALLSADDSAPENGLAARIERLASAVPDSFAAEGNCTDFVPLPALSLADMLQIETKGRVVDDVVEPMGFQKTPALEEFIRGGTRLANVNPSESRTELVRCTEEERACIREMGLKRNLSINKLGFEEQKVGGVNEGGAPTGRGHVADEEKGEAVETAGEKAAGSQLTGWGADEDLAVKKSLLRFMERFSSEQTLPSKEVFPSEARGGKEEACGAADIGAAERTGRGCDKLDLAVKKALLGLIERVSSEQTFLSEQILASEARGSKEEVPGAADIDANKPTGWESVSGEPQVGFGGEKKTGVKPTGLEEASGDTVEGDIFRQPGETELHTGWGSAAAKGGEEKSLQISGKIETEINSTPGRKAEKSVQVAGRNETGSQPTESKEATGGSKREGIRVSEPSFWDVYDLTETLPRGKLPGKERAEESDRVTEEDTAKETSMNGPDLVRHTVEAMNKLRAAIRTGLDPELGEGEVKRFEEVAKQEATGYGPNRPVILSYKEKMARLGAVKPTEWSPVEAEKAEGVTEEEDTGYPEPNRPVILSYKEKMARLKAVNPTEWSPGEAEIAEGVTEEEEESYPEPNRPVVVSYNEKLARLRAFSFTKTGPEATGSESTRRRRSPEEETASAEYPVDALRPTEWDSVEGTGWGLTNAQVVAQEALEKGVERKVVMAAGPEPPTEEEAPVIGKGKVGESSVLWDDLEAGLEWEKKLAKGAWRGASQVAAVTLQARKREEERLVAAADSESEGAESEADTDSDMPNLLDDSMAWPSEEELEPIDAARRIDAQGHHISFLSHQLRTCRKTISELEASCKEARAGRDTLNTLLRSARARENALNEKARACENALNRKIASLRDELDATWVKCIYLDYCSDPTRWRTDVLEESECCDQAAGRLVPVNERLPTQNLAILERIFDWPLASRFSAKQLGWLVRQFQSLICLPACMRAHAASKKDRLPNWLPAHVAKSKVDAIFRDGLEVWEVPGFAEMCARARVDFARDRAEGEEYDASCEEYVEMATGVAERLSAKYSESDVSGFEVFSDGPARQDYLQAWENEGDAIQCTEEPVDTNRPLDRSSVWDGGRFWRDAGILSGPGEEIYGAPVEQTRDDTWQLVFDAPEDTHAPPSSPLCRSAPTPSRSVLESSWAMDLQSELTDAVQGFADLFMDGSSSPVWDEIGNVLPVAVKEIQEEFARTAEEFTPGKLARGVSEMVLEVFEDFLREWGEDNEGW